jgi:hypothetical protein
MASTPVSQIGSQFRNDVREAREVLALQQSKHFLLRTLEISIFASVVTAA